MAGERLREAAQRLIPLEQGKFDNLCGLYSTLNAIALASWPTLERHSHRSRQLFQHGISALERKGLLKAVLKGGMTEDTWVWLCNKLLRKTERISGVKLVRSPLSKKIDKTDIDGMLMRFHRQTSLNRPVLVCLRGAYNHYTVVVEKTETQLRLFDSHGLRWVALSSCELLHGGAVARHQLARASAAALSSRK